MPNKFPEAECVFSFKTETVTFKIVIILYNITVLLYLWSNKCNLGENKRQKSYQSYQRYSFKQ